MSQPEDDAKMVEEMERLEREGTAGPWVDGYVTGFCRKEHGPDENGPWHGKGFCRYEYSVTESDAAHQLASTSAITNVVGNYDYEEGGVIKPEDHALITFSRNNLPRLLALAKIGLLAVKEYEAGNVEGKEEATTKAWIKAATSLASAIDAYKEQPK